MDKSADFSIAVIAMSGRFPGARDTTEFWSNLRNGVESVRPLTDAELAGSRVSADLLRRPDYVRAGGFLDDIDRFDANFFGFSVREAELTDPQQRLFLECAWEALEMGGYTGSEERSQTGVFASCSTSSYLLNNLYTSEQIVPSVLGLQMLVGNDKDYLATHVSYTLDLKGPSICVQTACSSSLVAVHLASQSLLNGECDLALAGGATVKVPQNSGYIHQDGLILSPDGHTYTFDERARGTVFGSGVGVVLLKRLADAIADRDTILAVIRGSAMNNDGSAKVGFTAPSVEGQARVITEALGVAGVAADTISYVEAHGTGTPLGDPIEVAALTQAYRATTTRTGYCAIGSVKANVGHLESAAGIAGLIKTILSLRNREIPPSINYERPNRQIDFARTPFYVSREAARWDSGSAPRRAGVSSFGFGGTNCHVVLEEAPRAAPARAASGMPLLLQISARTPASLKMLASRYREALPMLAQTASLEDVCYTAAHRRTHFAHRLSVRVGSFEDAREALSRSVEEDVVEKDARAAAPSDGRCVPLPPCPFDRERCWVEPASANAVRTDGANLEQHPLLERSYEVADHRDTRYWDCSPGNRRLSFLQDHVVAGRAVMPASAFVEAALAAAIEVFGSAGARLEEIVFSRMLPIGSDTKLQISIRIAERTFRIHGRVADRNWEIVASGTIGPPTVPTTQSISLDEVRSRCDAGIEADDYYRGLAEWGLAYGPRFRGIEEIRYGTGEAFARVTLPQGLNASEFHVHPSLLDSCLQAVGPLLHAPGSPARTFVPVAIHGLELRSDAHFDRACVQARLLAGSSDADHFDCALVVADFAGRILISIDRLRVRSIEEKQSPERADAGDSLYRVEWAEQPTPAAARPLGGTSWLVVGRGPGAREVRDALDRASAVHQSPRSAEEAASIIRSSAPRRLVYVAESDPDPVAAYEKNCGNLLTIAQAAIAASALDELWIVTSGAQWVNGQGSEDAIGTAGLWGFGRSLAAEYPDIRWVLIDVDVRSGNADALFAEFQSAAGENQIAFRDGKRFVARLERAVDAHAAPLPLRGDATYLITGGTGALGLQVASSLVDRGARHLVLTSRTAAPLRTDDPLLQRARVSLRRADVADEQSMRDLFTEIDATMPPLRGIIHAAGVLEDALLADQTPQRFTGAMRPKLAGAITLHRLTAGIDLDFFVMFSSAASLLGSAGQGCYSAANAAMDAVAHFRSAQGLPAVTVNWGPWSGEGMAARTAPSAQRRWESRGLKPLERRRALAILGSAMAAGSSPQFVALDADWKAAVGPLEFAPPFLSRLAVARPAPEQPNRFARELAAAPEQKRKELLRNHVRAIAGKLLAVRPEELHEDQPLHDVGLDSLMAIELRGALSASVGRTLPSTLLFDHPTIGAVVSYLLQNMSGQTDRAVAPAAGNADSLASEAVDRLVRMSDDEAEARLLAQLETMDHS